MKRTAFLLDVTDEDALEFWPRGTERIVAMEKAPSVDYTKALDSAMSDLDETWNVYRSKLENAK